MDYHSLAELEGAQTTPSQQYRPSVETRLERLAESQTELASARRQLLITRERVRTASRNVRLKRVDTGDAEVAFMDRLREFFNKSGDEIPETLLNAYNTVSQARDNLGEIEENYLQAERDLTGAEWRFMDQENGFYQFDLWNLVDEDHSNDVTTSQDQTQNVISHPLPPQPFPPHLGFNARSAGVFDTNNLPEPPHDPPLPSLRYAPATLNVTAPPVPASEAYSAKVAEVESLRKDFDQIRQTLASKLEWQEGGELLFANGVGSSTLDPVAPTSEVSSILDRLSKCEASAQQLKVAAMAGSFQAPARRYSDSAHDITLAQPCSASMRRTQTESAVHLLKDDPTTKEKIREWSLQYLKDSAIQKCIYLNVLEDSKVPVPTEDDWMERATRYWSYDSLSEGREGGEVERCATSTNETSHKAGSCHDLDVMQRAPSSLQFQHPPGEEMYPCDQEALDSLEMPREDCQDPSLIPATSLSYHHVAENIDIKTERLVAPFGEPILVLQQQESKRGNTVNGFAEQVRCTCPPEYGDAAQRKDSVQGTGMDHHSSCAMALDYRLGLHAQLSAPIPQILQTTTGPLTLHDNCNRASQSQYANVYSSAPVSFDTLNRVCVQPKFDNMARPASSIPPAHMAAASTPTIEAKSHFIESSGTPNPQTTFGRRKSSGSWFRWLPGSKNKRSKSYPSIGVLRAGVHACKQSVA